MGRLDEMESEINARLSALDRRIAERMAALDSRVGDAVGDAVFNKSSAAVGARSATGGALQAGKPVNVRRAAVCIGLKDVSKAAYPGELISLPGCPIDVDRFVCALGKIGFPEESVAVLKDEKATCAAVYSAISHAAAALQPGDLFVLLVSGHGGKDAWCLYDGQTKNRQIVWVLSRFRPGVRILVVNDQCHSGAFFSPKSSEPDSAFGMLCAKDGCNDAWDSDAAWRSPDFPMVMQFASCRAEQTSADGLAGGSWTQALINTLDQKLCVEGRSCSYREWFNNARTSPLLKSGRQDPECVESPSVTDVFRRAQALT